MCGERKLWPERSHKTSLPQIDSTPGPWQLCTLALDDRPCGPELHEDGTSWQQADPPKLLQKNPILRQQTASDGSVGIQGVVAREVADALFEDKLLDGLPDLRPLRPVRGASRVATLTERADWVPPPAAQHRCEGHLPGGEVVAPRLAAHRRVHVLSQLLGDPRYRLVWPPPARTAGYVHLLTVQRSPLPGGPQLRRRRRRRRRQWWRRRRGPYSLSGLDGYTHPRGHGGGGTVVCVAGRPVPVRARAILVKYLLDDGAHCSKQGRTTLTNKA
mmetsp:Transcript_32726/g.92244  ORF Transcript_32726/g.92244 Transcript_32726/m.92244 type:complete len:273 (-) Transcript_32726:12-830(-)